MKTIFICVVLLIIATGSFAQSNNTAEVEAVLKQFLAENAVSSCNFFHNRLTSDFCFINASGAISSRADVLSYSGR
jgi:hypothetical protein